MASLVISVKFGKGCYRHMHIPKKETLVELLGVILQIIILMVFVWIELFGAMRIFIMSVLLWEDLLRFLLKLSFCPAYKQKFKFSLDRPSILMRWFIVTC